MYYSFKLSLTVKTILVVLAILMLVLPVVIFLQTDKHTMTPQEFELMVRKDVHVGMDKNMLSEWLTIHHLVFVSVKDVGIAEVDHFDGTPIVEIAGVPRNEPVNFMRVLVSDLDTLFKTGSDVYFYFFFDRNNRLIEYYIHTVKHAL